MRNRWGIVLVIVAFAAIANLAAAAGEAPRVIITPVAKTDKTVIGQRIVVPDDPTAMVFLAEFPPGARLPEHRHPYPHLVYVLAGTLTVVNTETGRSFKAKKGDFVPEMQSTWHYGINNGKDPVKLLAIDLVPPGVTTNTIPRPAHQRPRPGP